MARFGDALAQRPTTDVDGQGDDFGVVLLTQPGDGNGGIQTTGVSEDDLLHAFPPPADGSLRAHGFVFAT